MRLFVAVVPPDDVLDALAMLRRPPLPGIRWTTRAQWHITLRFLGEVPDPAPVVEALDAAPLGPPRDVELGPAVVLLGHRVLCVPVAGLDDVAAAVVRATASLGRPPEKRRFRGHLTLARVARGDPSWVTGEEIASSFRADAVSLVQSRLHPTGAHYEELHRTLLR